MSNLKILSILILAFLLSGCSLIDNLKKKLGGESETRQVKEETAGTTSQKDLLFYNKYIEVVNKISETVEQFYKAYLNDVPEPKTIDRSSLIFVISTEVYAGNMERMYKDYNRSLFDNGELARLEADNETMKTEVEANLKEVLTVIGEFNNLAKEVVEYYKNKDYENNAPQAVVLDERVKEQYGKYKDAVDKLNSALKKYKPIKEMEDPDKITDPDRKAVVVLMNTYENTLDGGEQFFGKLQRTDKNSDVSELTKAIDDFETKFNEDKAKVQSTEFTDRTKYMKYNFEDYFSKTVNDFIKQARRFIENMKTKKMDSKEFSQSYDNVVTYYNYMVNAYNSSIGVLNTFQPY